MITPNTIQIAPSILACDLTRLADEIKAVEAAGADVLHFDIMDGHFVPNLTIGFAVLESARKVTKLPFDAHLMISHADSYIDEFKRVGCDWISVHVEACPHINRTLSRIKELGMKAGVAINPGTSLSMLDAVLGTADTVLVMSVNPGFGGQRFISATYDRVRELKIRLQGSTAKIEIDGGIKRHNIGGAVAAGAEIIVVGTGLFAQKDYVTTISELRKSAASTLTDKKLVL